MLLGAVFWVTREDVLCVMFLLLLVGLVEWMFGCSSHAPYPPFMLRLGCISGCIDSVSVPFDLVLRVRVCGDGVVWVVHVVQGLRFAFLRCVACVCVCAVVSRVACWIEFFLWRV